MDGRARFCFLVGWLDTHAQLTREYEFFFYPSDSTIEMYDRKQRRTFLKRSKADLKLQDLFIGAAINVHARQLTIRDFADEYTRKTLSPKMESTLLLVKPDGLSNLGKIIDVAIQAQFSICRARMFQVTLEMAEHLLGGDTAPHLIQSLVGGRSVAIEILKQDAVSTLANLVGPENVTTAKESAPDSIRAKFGSEGSKNAVHVPTNVADAKQIHQHPTRLGFTNAHVFPPIQQLAYIFGNELRNAPRTATFQDCTLGIIRPHAIIQGQTGKIIDMIQSSGFSITDLELQTLDRANGEDFLEVYKGVLPEYHLMLDQLTAGPLIAMEITGDSEVAIKFRDFVGPTDPELAKQVRPSSLRAKFGVDKVRNAFHCTDLPEDGVLEAQYFFKILPSQV